MNEPCLNHNTSQQSLPDISFKVFMGTLLCLPTKWWPNMPIVQGKRDDETVNVEHLPLRRQS